MENKTKSRWQDFVRDFGDALGGIMIGYGSAREMLSYTIIGTTLILLSVYLRFYAKNR